MTPLNGGLRATCRQARAGDGLPQTLVVPARFTGDLVRLVDQVLRPLERADRLLCGNLDETLWAACAAGGVRDARFLLEHGADANSIVPSPPKSLMFLVAERGYADLIHVLMDAGASLRDVSRRWRPWRRGSRSLSPYCIFMPIDAAIQGGHTRATLALLDRGYHDDEPRDASQRTRGGASARQRRSSPLWITARSTRCRRSWRGASGCGTFTWMWRCTPAFWTRWNTF
jgi:hypothetical protein